MARKKAQKQLYYKIGEACKLLDIQPYVLRYWETEFPELSPSKSKSGQRVYSEKELALIRRIKELLYDEGFTIAGAKKRLEAELEAGGPGEGEGQGPEETREAGDGELDTRAAERIEQLQQGLRAALGEAKEILALLDRKPP
ncbi:MAG TPA: MerR family transcriptional regulator [Thermoanaerobaculia bacterium]|nr:MerR family transcriptional regulator [Thermoanaerobaculia bacterium]